MHGLVAGLGREMFGPCDVRLRPHEGTSASGRDDLVAVEAEHAEVAEAARRLAAVRRTERLGRVLENRNIEAIADLSKTRSIHSPEPGASPPW